MKKTYRIFCSIICCPLTTIHGLKLMLTDRQIIDYGIAVVIGISFGNLILSLVENLFVPLLFSINHSHVEYGPGYIIFINNSTIIPYILNNNLNQSLNNSQIVKYNMVISSLLYFILVLITTYWITSIFVEYNVKKKCKYCLSDIHHLAIVCPYCTKDIIGSLV